MSKQTALFDDRTLEFLLGKKILHDSKVALIELIANAWDAGSTKVEITWPDKENPYFSIKDNGHGLSAAEFNRRWRRVNYNRKDEQGIFATFPGQAEDKPKRPVYGKNGLGRFSGFYFSDPYKVCTSDGKETNTYAVTSSNSGFLEFEKIANEHSIKSSGTIVYSNNSKIPALSLDDIKIEIGMRFLTDPLFEVYINNEKVSLFDIPAVNKTTWEIEFDGNKIEIIAIDVQNADKTTYQHGIAWHVDGRLVGDCSWKQYELDGRRTIAKRYTFIVKANLLNEEGCILPDWTGFNPHNHKSKNVIEAVHKEIHKFILSNSEGERKEQYEKIKKEAGAEIKKLGITGLDVWSQFVKNIQENCPTISENELIHISKILARLEASASKYSVVSKLSQLGSGDFDNLNEILENWSVAMAKTVLDEIQGRLSLIAQLKSKTSSIETDELHELQPLFEKSLWILGPEFESVEFTSNVGMTKVLGELLGVENAKGSRNRPDFVILPDSSIGCYSRPRYEGEIETGLEKLVILEFKKPAFPISADEKAQCWKYVKELTGKGVIQKFTDVKCFVVGKDVDPLEVGARTEGDNVSIRPMRFDTIISMAEKRMMNLYSKVKDAPFLQNQETKELVGLSEEIHAQAEMGV